MRLTLLLQDRKGSYLHHSVCDFPDITCLSDAGQRLPKFIISWTGRLFGFHSLNKEDAIIFREKELMICE